MGIIFVCVWLSLTNAVYEILVENDSGIPIADGVQMGGCAVLMGI